MATQVCEICREGVTDPVCMNCYEKELSIWLRENIGDEGIINYIRKKATIRILFDNLGTDYCIFCKKEKIFICKYCYFSAVKRILHEMNVPIHLIMDFSEIFNYQHYHIRNFPKMPLAGQN